MLGRMKQKVDKSINEMNEAMKVVSDEFTKSTAKAEEERIAKARSRAKLKNAAVKIQRMNKAANAFGPLRPELGDDESRPAVKLPSKRVAVGQEKNKAVADFLAAAATKKAAPPSSDAHPELNTNASPYG